MKLKIVLILSIILGSLAVFLQLEAFRETRDTLVKFAHKTLAPLFNCCPYHATLDVLSSFGFSVPKETKEEQGKNKDEDGVKSVIRYETWDRLFTKEELSKYKGEDDSLGLYLGILGRVYDVSSGEQYYAPGNGYSFFAGRDGTKAFMKGDFTEAGLIDEITGLNLQQMIELEEWIAFYEKTYIYKGKVIGNFYDETGVATEALLDAQERINEAHKDQESKEEHKRKYPPCNSSWTKENGGWVSCSDKSGGVTREWVGVPRKYHTPGQPKPKCVCIRTEGPPYQDPKSTANRGELDNPHIEDYEGCSPTAISCKVS